MSDSEQQIPVQQDENQLIAERRAKLTEWRKTGKAFPNDFQRENTAHKVHEGYEHKSAEELQAMPIEVKIAGRMMLKSVSWAKQLLPLWDMTGRIQIYISRDKIGETTYEEMKHWDLGDILGVVGTLMKTKVGELTVNIPKFAC